ncbi:MAG: hypothetical protein Q4C46_11755 [Bacillota bacterium]|nr:hypothetical protein [Bacillota bacterium]
MSKLNAVGSRIIFYIITFFTGIVVLPATTGVAFAFTLGGVICPIGGLIKLLGSAIGYDVPISLFDIGGFHMPIALGFLLSVALGIALFCAGNAMLEVYSSGDMKSPNYECGIWLPVCRIGMQEQYEAAEVVSTMTVTGIL